MVSNYTNTTSKEFKDIQAGKSILYGSPVCSTLSTSTWDSMNSQDDSDLDLNIDFSENRFFD